MLQYVINKEWENDSENTESKNIFNYNDNEVIIVMDKNARPWCKAKDIATILGYSKTKDAISTNVSNKNKKSYKNMGKVLNVPDIEIDPQTIFINQQGVLELIFKSRKPSAYKFFSWLVDKILPKLITEGMCTIAAKDSLMERLTNDFYKDQQLSDYENFPVVYFAYVGIHNGEHKLKWGHSKNFVRRELDEHRKDFETFNVIGIWKTLAYETVEDKIKINFDSKNMITPLQLKKRTKKGIALSTKREIITLSDIGELNYCLSMIEHVVKHTSSPQELEYQMKINECNHKYEILNIKYEHILEQKKLLEKNIEILQESNDCLRSQKKSKKNNKINNH